MKNVFKAICVIWLLCFGFHRTWAQLPYIAEKSYHRDSLLSELKLVEDIFYEGHAGLYNYSSKNKIEEAFEVARNSIQNDMTEREFTKVLAGLIGNIKCGHTFVRLSLKSLEERKESVGVFPLKLFFIEGNGYVLHNYTNDSSIIKGLEVTEVNGMKMSDIVNDIFPLIPADGGNQGWRYYQLGKNFDYYYRLNYGNVNNYTIRFSDGGSSRLESINPIDRDTLKSIRRAKYKSEISIPPLYFSKLKNDKIGYLRVNSFSDDACKRYDQSFKKYIKKSFKALKKEEIDNLILDLRGNVGGNTENVVDLARYLKKSSFRPYEKIVLKKNTALSYVNYTKKLEKFTFKNTIIENGEIIWENKKNTKEYKTKKNAFNGHLFVIIDGSVFSGGSHLSSLLDGRDKTLFIGEKTGGGAKFSTAGVMTTVTLPYTKVRLNVPMFKGVYSTQSPNKLAVFPTKKISPTQKGLLKNQDEVMQFVVFMINKMIQK